MGIKNAHKLTHTISGLTFGNIESIARMRMSNSQYVDNPQVRLLQPTIDVDISWLYRSRNRITEQNRIKHVVDICLQFSQMGFAVVLVCDGTVRHHSKRASIERNAKMYDNTIKSYIARGELMALSQQRIGTNNINDQKELFEKEKQLAADVKKLEQSEQASKIDVGTDFYLSLCAYIDGLPLKEFGNQNGNIYVIQAQFQADSVIAYRLINQITDISLCVDSDLACLAGSGCISIKSYKVMNKKLTDFEVFVANKKLIEDIKSWLHINPHTPKIKITISNCAVFDGVDCPRCRALIAVGLGCDVFTSGIKNLRSNDLFKLIHLNLNDNNYIELYHKIMDLLFQTYWKPKQQPTITEQYTQQMNQTKIQFQNTVNIYVDTILFEPCNFQTKYSELKKNINTTTEECINDVTTYGNLNIYLNNHPPIYLHMYIQEFARSKNEIKIIGCESDLSCCVGPGNGSHKFLSFEGHLCCSICQQICCYSCVFGTQHNLCVNCYMEELTIPASAITENVTTETMRYKLIDYGVDISHETSMSDIIDIYDAIVNKKQIVYDVDICNETTIPFECSKFMETLTPIINFDLRNGGSFICHQNLSMQHQIEILNLLSKMVDLYKKEEIENLLYSDTKLYSVIPKLYIEFANRARLHGGYRLLKRAARHATDPMSPGILESSAEIVSYHNKLSFKIQHVVKASMKKQQYKVQVCFNENGIVCCNCDCKAGCTNYDRVICVHVLPVLLQFTLLLFDGLSEHILYEISNNWYSMSADRIPDNQVDGLCTSVIKLLCAGGKTVESNVRLDKEWLLNELKNYFVGTLQFRPGPGPPDPATIGPLVMLDKQSPAQIIESICKRETRSTTPKKPPARIKDVQGDVDYDTCMYLLQVARSWFECDDECFNKCIGYKVLRHRSHNLPKNHDVLKQKLWDLLEQGKTTLRHTNTIKTSATPPSSEPVINEESSSSEDGLMTDTESDITDKKPPARVVEDANNYVSDISDEEEVDRVVKKQRRTCCESRCEVTTSTHKEAIWTAVPKPPCKPTKFKNDNAARTYHKKIFARNLWLQRLGLPVNEKRKFLFVCDNHPIEYEKLEFGWYDLSGKNQVSEEYLKVPRNPTLDNIRTRQQDSKRIAAKRRVSTRVYKLKPKELLLKKKKVGAKHYCSYVGCTHNHKIKNKPINFHRVPPIPKYVISNNVDDNPKNEMQIRAIFAKVAFREEFLRRIGCPNDKRPDIRICNYHGVDNHAQAIYWKDKEGRRFSTRILMKVPKTATKKSSLNNFISTTVNRGTANNRRTLRYIEEVKNKMDESDFRFVLMQSLEIESLDGDLHPAIRKAAGLDVHRESSKERKYGIVNKDIITKEIIYPEMTVVQINKLPKYATRHNTGFTSTCSLVCFVIIICNGNLELMEERSSTLTWFEEWYYFFERLYGRTMNRWCDTVTKYKKSERCLRKLFNNKLQILLKCRNNWPRYLTYLEDSSLRGARWESSYDNKRVIFWDNTNVPIAQPSSSEGQRNTYSAYYAGNVGKGAVFIQPSGWMGTHDLWMGAVSDTDYFTKSGILEQQSKFLEIYDKDYCDVQWINVLDKGYRVVEAAWRAGKQFVLQPTFAKVDKKFTAYETIRSAAVASDRAGNERAVRLAKMSSYLHNGTKPNQAIETLCDVWLAWGFVCNFVYQCVYR